MNWLNRISRPGAVIILIVALLSAEVGVVQWQRGQAQHTLAALEQIKQERARLVRQSPALSAENERAIERDLAGAEKSLATLQAFWTGEAAPVSAQEVPAKSMDAYFELTAYVERVRTLAGQARVILKADDRFGFATHLHEGPESALVPAVNRQRIRLQFLVETLLGARPQTLFAVQREPPLTAAQRAERNQGKPPGPARVGPAGAGGPAGDFFTIDPLISLRTSGLVESEAFRLEFSGQTRTLRAFLSSLADCPQPIVVRSVEVEPLPAPASTMGRTLPPDAGAPSPLVAQNPSRFTVVVEFIEPAVTTGKPAS